MSYNRPCYYLYHSVFILIKHSILSFTRYTLLALITPALSQRRPLFRQEQILTYRHLGPLLIGKNR